MSKILLDLSLCSSSSTSRIFADVLNEIYLDRSHDFVILYTNRQSEWVQPFLRLATPNVEYREFTAKSLLVCQLQIFCFVKNLAHSSSLSLVYSLFGPSSLCLIGGKVPYVCMYAVPFITPVYKLSFIKRYPCFAARQFLRNFLLDRFLLNFCSLVLVETPYLRDYLSRSILSDKHLILVGNKIASCFEPNESNEYIQAKQSNRKSLVFSSNNSPHKDLLFLLEALAFYESKYSYNALSLDVIVTVTESELTTRQLKALKRIQTININFVGRVSPPSLREVYLNSQAMIMCSQAEVFSANYVEALQFKLPLICPDLEIHYSLLGDAGIYYSNYSLPSFVTTLNAIIYPSTNYYQSQAFARVCQDRLTALNSFCRGRYSALISSLTKS